MKRRYKHILWDGIIDTQADPEKYMTNDEIVKVMNDTNNQIRVWKRKYDEIKNKYERCKNGKKEN